MAGSCFQQSLLYGAAALEKRLEICLDLFPSLLGEDFRDDTCDCHDAAAFKYLNCVLDHAGCTSSLGDLRDAPIGIKLRWGLDEGGEDHGEDCGETEVPI